MVKLVKEQYVKQGGNFDEVNLNGHSPIFVASIKGFDDIFFELQDLSNLNIQDIEGDSMLHWAIAGQELDWAEQLINLKIKLNLKNKNGNSPFHLACLNGY